MARKSRKNEKIYKESKELMLTALYARKSVEDGESLENQVSLLKNYLEESKDLKLYKIYEDNGFSGTSMERPGFTRMMDDMLAGRFQAILVKDGSRLGRNFLEVGKLTEKIFPALGIRFISINDWYDSKDSQSDSLSMPLKNLINEQYSKDLSRKLSPAFRTKQMAGEYIGPYGPYGYLKSDKDRHKLVIDHDTAPNVLKIFEMKCNGMGNGKIAEYLNKEGILSPSAYRYKKNLVKSEKYKEMKWTSSIINSIVTNQMYIGNMVQGVHRQSMSNREKRHRLNEEEWIIVENTHEAIVSQELFEQVQSIVKMRREKHKEYCSNVIHSPTKNLLRKKIYCKECGRAMEIGISRTTEGTHYYYRCKYAGITNGAGCKKRSIKKEDVENKIIDIINLYKNLFLELNESQKEYNQSKKGKEKLRQLHEEKESLQKKQEKYTKNIKRCNQKIQEIERQIQQFGEEYMIGENAIKMFDNLIIGNELSQEVVDAFVEKVEVSSEGNMNIKLTFQDEYLTALQLQRERQGLDCGCKE